MEHRNIALTISKARIRINYVNPRSMAISGNANYYGFLPTNFIILSPWAIFGDICQ
jgi:hypothetical protein